MESKWGIDAVCPDVNTAIAAAADAPPMDMLWHVLVITTCISLPTKRSHQCHLLGGILLSLSSLHFLVPACAATSFMWMHLHRPYHTQIVSDTPTTIFRGATSTHASLTFSQYKQDKHSGTMLFLHNLSNCRSHMNLPSNGNGLYQSTVRQPEHA